MKGLIWNCKKVTWKHTGDNYHTLNNCLLVYLCCETNDSLKEVKETTRRVAQLNKKRYMVKNMIIMPFAHLSNDILDNKLATKLLDNIKSKLESELNVVKLGFNKDKELIIHLLPNNKDVSYFSY